jgi:WS/DGAT/MGAT family acyltransferase
MPDSRSRFENVLLDFETQATPQVMAALCWLDRLPDLARLRERIQVAVDRFPRLSQLAVAAPRLTWSPAPDFQLESHLENLELPEARSRGDFLDEVGRQFSRKLETDRPRWRVIILSGRRASVETCTVSNTTEVCSPTAILFVIHHTYADGIRGLGLVEALADCGENPAPGSASGPGPRRYRPSAGWLGRFWQGVRSVGKMWSNHVTPRGESCMNGDPSPQRRVLLAELERDIFRPVMRQFRCSLHAVLLAAVAGALRAYQLLKGGPVQDLRIITSVTTHLGPVTSGLGNYLAAFPLLLPLTDPSPVRRLMQMSNALQRSHTDGSLSLLTIGLTLLDWAPRWLRPRMIATMGRQCCLACAFVPGSRKRQHIASAQVEAVYGLPPHQGDQGASFTFVTYRRAVHVSIVTDPQVVPEPAPLLDCLRQGIKEILECAANGTRVASTAR